MNYYEHHIGDYAEATAHLTFVEDAAYSRLIRKYYASENPLPVNLQQVQRLVGARTKEEKSAVQSVLEEFFILQDDGWHQERCDRSIAEYQDGEPERVIKKANEDARMKRHREERSKLFSLLNEAGQHAPWNISMTDLRGLVQRFCNAAPATPATGNGNAPATAPATPATATQSPDTSNQCSVPNGTGDKPPLITDPNEIIFGYGLALLTNAGTVEKQARSFLGGLRKHHGDDALIDKLRECAKAKPLQPLEWLAAALPPGGIKAKTAMHAGFEKQNYHETL